MLIPFIMMSIAAGRGRANHRAIWMAVASFMLIALSTSGRTAFGPHPHGVLPVMVAECSFVIPADDLHFGLLVRVRRSPAPDRVRPSLQDKPICDRDSLPAAPCVGTLMHVGVAVEQDSGCAGINFYFSRYHVAAIELRERINPCATR